MAESNRRKKEMRKHRITVLLVTLAILALAGMIVYFTSSDNIKKFFSEKEEETTEEETEDPDEVEAARVAEVIAQAEIIAAGYDFDAAIEYLKSDEAYRQTLSMLVEVENLEARKETMVEWSDVRTIPHIYVRPLIADEEKAFSSENASTYASDYITVDEFKALLNELYENDYVLVSIHDVAAMQEYVVKKETEETTEETGTVIKMTTGSIYLPEGKKPIVLSVENACYTETMSEEGFASRLVLLDDGTVTCEMVDGDDVSYGAYDVVPVLEEFITEHPDFSYQSARAVLGITGIYGVLGYHTSYLYMDEDTYVDNTTAARLLVEQLKELGYEIGCNGYNYAGVSESVMDDETFVSEMNSWLNETASVVGKTDIFIFPYGDDVGDWHYYSGGRYETLKKLGYDYFINMNSSETSWNQILDDYMRQGRREISGKTLTEAVQGSGAFEDLFDASAVLITDRNY